MKKSILVMTAAVAMVFFGCKESPYMSAPGDNSLNTDSIPTIADPEPSPDMEGVEVPAGTITVNDAVKIAMKLPAGSTATEKYFIKGWVTSFDSKGRGDSFDEDFPKYGNDYVWLSARQDGKGTKQFYAHRVLGKFGAKLPDLECISVGDFVVISCYPMNYNGTYESSGACFIYSSSNAHFNEVYPAFPGAPTLKEGELSVTDAEKIALSIEKKATTEETYLIRGIVTGVTDTSLSSYGNLTFNISDGQSYATCYRLMGKNNGKFKSLNQVQVGDEVLVEAKIQNYNGTCEPVNGYVKESSNPYFNKLK